MNIEVEVEPKETMRRTGGVKVLDERSNVRYGRSRKRCRINDFQICFSNPPPKF
jgi:hypothetical protein